MTTFNATPGDDIFTGQKPYDEVSYADASSGVTVDLSVSGPQNTGGSGSDTFVSITDLIGSAYGDALTGDDHANHLFGGAGDDVLISGPVNLVPDTGWDSLDGGAGVDTAVFSGNWADYDIDQMYPYDAPDVLQIMGGTEGFPQHRIPAFCRPYDQRLQHARHEDRLHR